MVSPFAAISCPIQLTSTIEILSGFNEIGVAFSTPFQREYLQLFELLQMANGFPRPFETNRGW